MQEDDLPHPLPGWLVTVVRLVVYLVGVLAVMSTVVSLVTFPPGTDPSIVAKAHGGSSWWGYQTVHAGPGLAVLALGVVVAARRRRKHRPTPFTDMREPLD